MAAQLDEPNPDGSVSRDAELEWLFSLVSAFQHSQRPELLEMMKRLALLRVEPPKREDAA